MDRVEKDGEREATDEPPGEGGGAGGGLPRCWICGGGGGGWAGVGGGSEAKAGCVARNVATLKGDDHRSSGVRVVGRAGQSKMCFTV